MRGMMRLVVGVLLLTGCSPAAPSVAPTHDLTGTVTFTGGTVGHTDCHGVGAYADMAAGTDVLVLDGASATIGKGVLAVQDGSGGGTCVFAFSSSVPEVPFYTFRIAERDAPTYSLAEMHAAGWAVEFSVRQDD